MRRRDWELPVRVLAVEDSPEDAALVRSVLTGEPGLRFELTIRDRLQAGLDHLEQEDVDIVLLDFSLPDSKGLDTFRRVNAEHPEVPIIVLTSLEDDAVAVQAVAEGAQDYLLFAASGAATPSMAPLPKREGSLASFFSSM